MIFMKGQMKSFLLFIAGIFVILILMQTVFGRGIAYNILGFLSEAEPSHLQDDIRTMLTEASYAPGEFEGKIKVTFKHNITITDSPYHTVLVETPTQFKLTTEELKPESFLSSCDIVKTCVRICKIAGEHCRVDSDCCNGLECNYTTLICENITSCQNSIIEPWEECDIGPDLIPNTVDDVNTLCPSKCQKNCTCSNKPLCSDGIDNDVDGKCDWNGCCSIYHDPIYNIVECQRNSGIWLPADPGCENNKNDNDETDTSTCRNNVREGLEACDGTDNAACPNKCNNLDCSCYLNNEGENCIDDIECGRTNCLSRVIFDKINGVLVIKKFFEGNTCKIKIEKG